MRPAERPINMMRKPDRLVVEGVRRCLAGYATGDHGCWELALTLFERELGRSKARRAISDMSFFARDLHLHARRVFCLFPYDCPKLCQDECLIAAMVSAAQSGDGETLIAIAGALVEASGQEDICASARALAQSLSEIDLALSPVQAGALSLEDCPVKKLLRPN
ncbi:hypothetical protein [Roseibium sp. RKSG952]|uniref:hypothetical protein n=1 Tax=Roseibium sp. RKSG952 TaxID=2529384 RepID=UPI0012BD3B0A|nr:hypothetical protein [Roseibium sp. RKSG952]MTH96910.1 hypothetical protein [Roseibium sp. RKSG952]